MMLYYSKVQKFGMVSLTGLICGILMLLTGMGYWSIITGAVFGVLADLVLKSGDYKSAKKGNTYRMVFFLCGSSETTSPLLQHGTATISS